MELRPYQKAAISECERHWQEWDKEILVLPTGCGKTICFNQIARDRSRNGNVLILAHRDELIEQAREKFNGGTGKIKANENMVLPVTVGSVQTMSRRTYPSDMWQTIIVDECHHAISDSYQAILQQFPMAKVLGVTATVDRGDKKSLAQYFDGIAYEYTFRQAVSEGYLVKPVARCVPLEIDMSSVKVSVGDFEVTGIAEALSPYLPEIAKAIKEYAADRKTIVFMPLIEIAQEFRDVLIENGVDAREVNGNSKDRTETLEWFHNASKGSVLINSMLLTEGYDEPSIDCVVVLRPTKIRSLYSQMVGRGTRLYPGKKDLLILDFLWMTQKHDLCRPADLVAENVSDKKHIKEKSETEEIDLFDCFSDAVEARRNALARELEKQKQKKAKLIDPMQFFVAIGDMEFSDYEPVFPWQGKDPTEKQIALLQKFGLNPDNFDRGKASLVIDKLLGRKDLARPKQIMLLRKFGYKPENWTAQMASQKIKALAAVNWQRWKLRDG